MFTELEWVIASECNEKESIDWRGENIESLVTECIESSGEPDELDDSFVTGLWANVGGETLGEEVLTDDIGDEVVLENRQEAEENFLCISDGELLTVVVDVIVELEEVVV